MTRRNTRRDRDVWLLWPDSGTLERITRNDFADGSSSVSADGRYIAWTEDPDDVPDDQTWIRLMDRNDNTSRRLVIDGDLGAHMQFIGNSHDLVTTSRGQIVRPTVT